MILERTRRGARGAALAVLLAAGCASPMPATVVATQAHPDTATEFTLVALPDTQYYSAAHPEIFDAQTRWIAAHEADHHIAAVVHEGDIVDADEPWQWARAFESLHRLDDVVPYLLSHRQPRLRAHRQHHRPRHPHRRLLPRAGGRARLARRGDVRARARREQLPDHRRARRRVADPDAGVRTARRRARLGRRRLAPALVDARDRRDSRLSALGRHALRPRHAGARLESAPLRRRRRSRRRQRRPGDLAQAHRAQQQRPLRAVRTRSGRRRRAPHQRAPRRLARAPDPRQLSDGRARRRRLPAPDALRARRAAASRCARTRRISIASRATPRTPSISSTRLLCPVSARLRGALRVAGQVVRRSDQRQVRERLREIAEQARARAGSYSSESRPRSLRTASKRSKSARASSMRPICT